MSNDILCHLDGERFDAVIVGGGINGASTAQHLCAAGFRVLLVEHGDFADGATSRSSRLLHCGLRHFATGSNIWNTFKNPIQFMRSLATIKADMTSRDEIVRIIPNRLKSFNFCLPIYEDDPYSPWHLDMAFFALRMASPMGVPLNYRRYKKYELSKIPINGWFRDMDKLRSAAVFEEYQFDWPERIALDAIFDARRMGAKIINYTKVGALTPPKNSGEPWDLALQSIYGDETAHILTDLVFNLTGAWVDKIIRDTGKKIHQKCLGLKGVHIAVKLPDEFSDWGVFAFNSIGEPLYCLPGQGLHYIGLTRTKFVGNESNVFATDEEIKWLVREINRVMPALSISTADVLFSWAGINPLTFDQNHEKGTRDIVIHDLKSEGLTGLFTLTGGAIMTHRRVARKFVKLAAAYLTPSNASQIPNSQFKASKNETNAPRLTSEHGSISIAEVERVTREEKVHNLSDVLMRRLGLGWMPDQGMGLARPVAEKMAPILGWNNERIEREVDGYSRLLRTVRRKYQG